MKSEVRFSDKRVRSDTNVWTVSGYVTRGKVVLTEIHGDITDRAGILRAVTAMVNSKARYQRALS